MDVILACDIGGTNSRVSIRNAATGEELGSRTIGSTGYGYDASLANLTATVRNLRDTHTLVGGGVGVAGAVKDGMIVGSGNLPDWVNHNYKVDLERELNAPIVVMNDCAAAALGEYAAFQQPLIYVIWGTGVGVAVVDSDGNVKSTELGHMIIDRNSRFQCGCGGFGHLEALVSGGNIPQRFGHEATDLTENEWDQVLLDMAAGLRSLSAGDMGYPIVLGGGVICKQASRLSALQRKVNGLESTAPVPELLLAKGGESSGMHGAVFAARRLVGTN